VPPHWNVGPQNKATFGSSIDREAIRIAVFSSYDFALPAPVNEYEFDHLIPLGLGGLETIEDMWPRAMHPTPGAREKDKV
jgi:hypothetical protein